MAYCSRSDVKIRLRIPVSETEYDTLIDKYISDADSEIDDRIKDYVSVPLSPVPASIANISAQLAAAFTRVALWKGGDRAREQSELEMREARRRLNQYIKETYLRDRNEDRARIKIAEGD